MSNSSSSIEMLYYTAFRNNMDDDLLKKLYRSINRQIYDTLTLDTKTVCDWG